MHIKKSRGKSKPFTNEYTFNRIKKNKIKLISSNNSISLAE